MKINVKKLHPDAKLPTYGTEGAACFDLYAVCPMPEGIQDPPDWNTIIEPGRARTFETGLAFEIPDGHVMLIYSRSGHGFKNDVRMANCVGVADSDFRGSIKVRLSNDSDIGDTWKPNFVVSRYDRIAQAMIIPVEQVQFQIVEELSETKRGEGGYGSTGS